MKKSSIFIPLIIASTLSGCGKKQKMPTFGNESLSLVAYSGPTSKACSYNTAIEKHFKEVADAGFTHILALYDGNCSNGTTIDETLAFRYTQAERDALIALDFCQKYGLKYYVRDWNLYGLSKNTSDSNLYKLGINNLTPEDVEGTNILPRISDDPYGYAMKGILPDECQYIRHPAYAGSYLFDEPYYDEMKEIGKVVDAYNKRTSELGINGSTYINLLPSVTSNPQIMGPSGYDGYIEEYVRTIGSKVGYLSFDCYPLMKDSVGNYIKGMHLYNLQTAALKCKQYGLELRSYIQTGGDFTGMRDFTSIADFRFQLYSNLAFGSHYITYYEYAKKKSSASQGQFGILNLQNGTLNWTYDCVKAANNEIRAFENVLCSYVYDNIMYKSANEKFKSQSFSTLRDPLRSSDKVSIKSVSEDTFLTLMKNKYDNSDAFMLMNYSEPSGNKTDTVTLNFKKAKSLLMYRLGQKMTVDLPRSGDYTFKLCAGEGRFIIPLY